MRSKLHCRKWIRGMRKGTYRRKTNNLLHFLLIRSTSMQMEQNLLQILRNQEKDNIKFIGDLHKMQCTGFGCPQHKMLVQNFGKRVLMPLLRTSLCPKNASSRLSAKVGRENCSRDSSHLDNDQKYHLDHHGFIPDPILQACLGKPKVICKHGILTRMLQGAVLGRRRKSNSLLISESTALPTTRLTRTSSTCKESQNKSKNL